VARLANNVAATKLPRPVLNTIKFVFAARAARVGKDKACNGGSPGNYRNNNKTTGVMSGGRGNRCGRYLPIEENIQRT